MNKSPAALTAAQSRVLDLLVGAGRPVSVVDLQEQTGLHANTLRNHLDALVAAGRVSAVPLRRSARGRPALGYWARHDEYADLALALATAVSTGTAGEAVSDVGVARGRALADQIDESDPLERLRVALTHTGFDPEVDSSGGDSGMWLRSCPLLRAAEAHPEVVCRVHQGVIDGVLAGERAAALRPFARPSACFVSLS